VNFVLRLAWVSGETVIVPAMRVWIDQDLCTGDGLCLDHCPDVFVQLEDGIAYVAEAGQALNDPGGGGSLAWVPLRHYQSVVDAAEACPGECIFIEMPVTPAGELRASAGK
jgi:ferredoxin